MQLFYFHRDRIVNQVLDELGIELSNELTGKKLVFF